MTLSLLLIIFVLPYCLGEVWTVYVYTGDQRFAGTDSNVYIRLFNSDGESTSESQLTHSNWLPDDNDFPIRNLFETGARERFRLLTEYIGSVAKIQIRHNNFPSFQANWLLEQVIVERNRDGAKYIFKCNCWLTKENPSTIIPVLPDQRAIDKNKGKIFFSKTNRAFIIILIVLITLFLCIFCCYNEYRRRQRHRSLSFNDTIEQIQQEPSLLDTDHPQTSRALSGPQLWINTIRHWKNVRHELPSYNHTRTTQSTPAVSSTIIATDEPPAYKDLYPDGTTTRTPTLNSNL